MSLAVSIILASLAALPAAYTPVAPRYEIDLNLEPASSRLQAKARHFDLACVNGRTLLYLNRSLAITEVAVDGAVVELRYDPPAAPRSFYSRARPFDIPCPARSATIRYSGPGDLSSDGRNQVSPQLVELAQYGVWYPMIDTATPISGRVTITLPSGWRDAWASSAPRKRQSTRQISLEWPQPTTDFTFVSSPAFVRRQAARDVDMLIRRDLPAALAADGDRLGSAAQAAVDLYAGWLGRRPGGRVTLAFTPRGGQLAYARTPLIIIQEDRLAVTADADPRSPTVNIRHEVAHFWSNAARTTRDDRVNEGVAEFLAYRATRRIDGEAAHARLIAAARTAAEATRAGSSPLAPEEDTTVNRYFRPACF